MKSFAFAVKTILIIFLSLMIGMTCDNINDFGYPLIGGQIAAPTFSPSAGTYTSAQTVTISTTATGSTIWYTTDGSTPNCGTGTSGGSGVTSFTVSVSTTTTINAMACQTNYADSSVSSATYTIGYASTQPDAVSGLQLWLKADSISQTDGTAVNTWSDSSGNGNDATAVNPPTFINDGSGPNSMPMVSFDGINDYLTYSGNFFVNSSMSIFVVIRITNPKVDNYPLGGTAGALYQNLQFGVYASSLNWMNFGFWGNSFFWTGYSSGSDDLLVCWFDKTSLNRAIYYKGELKASGTSLSVLISYTGSQIGKYLTSYFRGYIAEIIAYNQVLSDTNRQGVECYLSNKYAITVSQTCQ